MPPILDGTASDFGAPEPSRMERIWNDASPKLWGLFAGTLVFAAAVGWERWL